MQKTRCLQQHTLNMAQKRIAVQRKRLTHQVPSWVDHSAVFFVTVCALPRGSNILCQPNLAKRLWETVVFRRELGQWWVHLLLLMPDHLHMLVSFSEDRRMAQVVSAWKRYLAKQEPIQWQRDFFDHRLRCQESLNQKSEYILQNPVRAGLVQAAEEWPYVWRGDLHG
jgi:REP-associated tyrosine transposase